jgi:hypothetical protein
MCKSDVKNVLQKTDNKTTLKDQSFFLLLVFEAIRLQPLVRLAAIHIDQVTNLQLLLRMDNMFTKLISNLSSVLLRFGMVVALSLLKH